MPKNGNGSKRKARKKAETEVEGCESCPTSADADEKHFPPEILFKGILKIPVVVLDRTDITPFLKTAPVSSTKPAKPDTNLIDTLKKHTDKFFLCSVKLARDDLEQLKESVMMSEKYAFVTCRICKKNYPDMRKLRNHQALKHMIVYEQKPQKRVSFSDHVIVHELKEYHKCRKCAKIFENYRCLKAHMKKDHKKRKCYICHYCQKSFVDRSIFKVHIKLHCDVCGELMPNKATYTDHRRNVCRVLKKYKCKTCKESFFHFMDLKDHSYDHFGVYYICDICKDQLPTKCAVSHHIACLHSEQRPTSMYECRSLGNEKLYLCNFCEETSVEKDALEKHVEMLPDLSNKAMTGYKDYYFCDQCLRKFDKENEMLQHKWTHFLKSDQEKTDDSKNVGKRRRESDELLDRNKKIKLPSTVKVTDKIPEYMLPKVVLKKVTIPIPNEPPKVLNPEVGLDNGVNKSMDDETILKSVFTQKPGKAIVDPKSKKTLLSKHQCEQCFKYFSSGYCLRRHLQAVHNTHENLQCPDCEETFFWPSLLHRHNCLRTHQPEMPFDDARPEIHFDNFYINSLMQPEEISQMEDLTALDGDYSDCIDFEIPAPIVELTEGSFVANGSCQSGVLFDGKMDALKNGYKVVMQEVPIEF
ncbi:zinc finger protein 658B [Plutella xylostella]|uniref:zinc finger protein 658B n=1 Tax=Plutella xylostella TaxID=51655 RepID=UPI002032C442|nr:zinc finger protein 658B [Plutella xylostella]